MAVFAEMVRKGLFEEVTAKLRVEVSEERARQTFGKLVYAAEIADIKTQRQGASSAPHSGIFDCLVCGGHRLGH
jgi:hypothetical protein